MIAKDTEKDKAIALRKQGKTYAEIISVVPVAKSTLSLWLRSIGLSKVQKQRITEKRKASQQRGGEARQRQRFVETEAIHEKALREIGSLTQRERLLLGVALYWAEGTKERKGGRTVMLEFANSDPAMVNIFVSWLLSFGNVPKEQIIVRLHLHDSHRKHENEIRRYWSDALGIPSHQFTKTNFKKHAVTTKQRKVGQEYKGLVSIRVPKSTNLNRRIQGLIYAIIAQHKNCQIV